MSNDHHRKATATIRIWALAVVIGLLLPGQAAYAGQAGWDALKNGTAFVIMRHALAPGTGDPGNFDVNDCTTQRNLSDRGRQQARDTGELFRTNGIAAADVFTSAWCRCRETAELLALGAVRTLEPLNSFFRQRDRREPQTTALKDWLQVHSGDKPLVLVTHQVNITALTGIFPTSGELIFVETGSDGSLRVVDRTVTSQ
ncbi:MAG: histidine phosphatase family protein [Pseudomonadota bacterium]